MNGKAPHDCIIHNERFFHRLAYDGTLAVGESYMEGWWDCKRLDEFFYKLFKAEIYQKLLFPWDRLICYLTYDAFNLQTLERSWEIAEKHYDLGNMTH